MNAWKNLFVTIATAAVIGFLATYSQSKPLAKDKEAPSKSNTAFGPPAKPIVTLHADSDTAEQLPEIFSNTKVHLRVQIERNGDTLGDIRVLVDGSEFATTKVEATPVDLRLPVNLASFANRSAHWLAVQWVPKPGDGPPRSSLSDPIKFHVDTQGPIVDGVRLVGTAGAAPSLLIQFRELDIDEDSAETAGNYVFRALGSQANASVRTGPILEGDMVRIALQHLETGDYEVTIKNVADRVGNLSGVADKNAVEQKFVFSSYPQRETGPHVEFPEFVPRPKHDPNKEFNPNDKVETRVARLYYYRDAHRVAQIINRNVKSYNQAAVDHARREADDARVKADKATDKRREEEREAIRKAQATREIENKIQELQLKIAELDREEDQIQLFTIKAEAAKNARATKRDQLTKARESNAEAIKKKQEEIKALEAKDTESPPPPTTKSATKATTAKETAADKDQAKDEDEAPELVQARKELKELEERDAALAEELNALNLELGDAERKLTLADDKLREIPATRLALQGEIRQHNQKLPALREAEAQARETMDRAQATEDRAREDQFRKEVRAAKEDPDTYVPAKIESVDPVTQVSISVIGEGLIQLRGPIRGVNKIRTMINQIDAPVGQVKVGIFTVQVNGEHGNRMEKVAQRIEGHVDISRFLTSQSLLLLRRAVQETAAHCAERADAEYPGRHLQADRDRKYMYYFFGRDFTDELYAMDSELLRSGNKILSVHAMDTVSLSKAMFLISLARNDVREEILRRFMELVDGELPHAEYDFRKASKLLPCRLNSIREIQENVWQTYRFRSIRGFFRADVACADTMTPMQREFIRLAQIFKSQMVAEMELKQRVIERGLIQDRANEDERRRDLLAPVHGEALLGVRNAYEKMIRLDPKLEEGLLEANQALAKWESKYESINSNVILASANKTTAQLTNRFNNIRAAYGEKYRAGQVQNLTAPLPLTGNVAITRHGTLTGLDDLVPLLRQIKKLVEPDKKSPHLESIAKNVDDLLAQEKFVAQGELTIGGLGDLQGAISVFETISKERARWTTIKQLFSQFFRLALQPTRNWEEVEATYLQLVAAIGETESEEEKKFKTTVDAAYAQAFEADQAEGRIARSEYLTSKTREQLDHKKLLEHLIDEHEEKHIELIEGTRAHIAAMDNYLKRLAIAIEDDCKVQFYDPAFSGIRKSAYEYDVQLGQVERTTILTNNRAFAKVSPQATMEFDLPKRDIMIVEAMNGAKALTQDFGALLNDPTFLAATQMLSGSPATGGTGKVESGESPLVKDVLPGLPSDREEQVVRQQGNAERPLGAALEALIPDPAIYKFETGTGFEIRPVIQPDGDSIVYDFNYMYTTNMREPVRADEKHLGRVKQHFIDTEVQTSSFELREISRYQVALKASRTGRGVPLLEDIPGLGILFRPLASDESALQQNIILGQSTVYPTLFDLMGLRWAPHVVDVDHTTLRDAEHIARGRRQTISDFVFEEASDRVDGFLGIKDKYKHLHRPDLYHSRTRPSRYHPSGYEESGVFDPTGDDFHRADPRPHELRDQPRYDHHGRPIDESDPRRHLHLHQDSDDAAPEHIILPNPSGVTPTPSHHPENVPLGSRAAPGRNTTAKGGSRDAIRQAEYTQPPSQKSTPRTRDSAPTAADDKNAEGESRFRKLMRKLPFGERSND